MKLALLDVGHGSCVVAHEGADAIVIDAPSGEVLREYIRLSRITRIVELIISHADKDHCGGVAMLVEDGVDIGRIWYNSDLTKETEPIRALKKVFKRSRESDQVLIERGWPHSDQGVLDFGDLSFELLSPLHEDLITSGPTSNQMSATVRIVSRRLDGGLALVMADVDEEYFWTAVGSPPNRDLRARWLVAPHHGGLTGSPAASARFTVDLLRSSEASQLFVSMSRGRSSNRPRPEIVAAIGRATDLEVHLRCSQLSTQCGATPPQFHESGFQSELGESMLRRDGSACAGSVVLDEDEDYSWRMEDAHESFIDGVDGKPLCRYLAIPN